MKGSIMNLYKDMDQLERYKQYQKHFPMIRNFLEALYKEAHMGIAGEDLIWGFTPNEWNKLIGKENQK